MLQRSDGSDEEEEETNYTTVEIGQSIEDLCGIQPSEEERKTDGRSDYMNAQIIEHEKCGKKLTNYAELEFGSK